MSLRLLILGGTAEARALAARVAVLPHVRATSSLAGAVDEPALPEGDVRVGGFGGVDGLATVLEEESYDAVIDATHPFATQISAHARAACERTGTPLLAFEREPWERVADDDWRVVSDVPEAALRAASMGQRIFVTVGRKELGPFAADDQHWYLLRMIDKPYVSLPRHHELILERGPFQVDDEIRLLRDREIDVIVSKNSGGDATYAKIAAARALKIPVVMVDRPNTNAAPSVSTLDAAMQWIGELTPP